MRLLTLLLIVWAASALNAQASRDILIKSRFDLPSSRSFIEQMRSFLTSNGIGDPYNQQFKKPIVVDLGGVMDDLPAETQKWLLELQTVLRLRLFDSEFRLVTEGLGYSIQDFNSEFLPLPSDDGKRVHYVTYNYVKGLRLYADRVAFEIELKQTHTIEPIKFQIELIGPYFNVSPELLMDLPMGWTSSLLPDDLKLTLHTVDLETVFIEMVKRPDLIDFDVQDLRLPDVSVRVGRKEINFDNQKIRQFLLRNKESIKRGILDVLKTRMQGRFANIIKDMPVEVDLQRKLEINNKIHGVIELQESKANNTGILEFGLDGHFCRLAEPDIMELFCPNGKVPAFPPRRKISEESYQRSSRAINRSLIESSSNLTFSVSEDFINRLISATIKAGLWDKMLEEKDLKLGPEGCFVIAEEKGENFSLYLDVIHTLRGAQRVLVGRSELRFPVKLKIALKTEEVDGIPHLKLLVTEVATDEELVLRGAPEYGIHATVATVPRFRGKVLKSIMEDVSQFEGQSLIDLGLPELKGTYIRQLEFTSDGLGRANATINFIKKN